MHRLRVDTCLALQAAMMSACVVGATQATASAAAANAAAVSIMVPKPGPAPGLRCGAINVDRRRIALVPKLPLSSRFLPRDRACAAFL